ncbi:outer membrane efflux protein [Pseudomonas syringae]|uniref:TolC family protein n=1 Tax=Pseudomonas syringae TaxID=317 RepID=UPI0010275EFC|nr:outer membrane efflux protein [Pseudomonas syringae]
MFCPSFARGMGRAQGQSRRRDRSPAVAGPPGRPAPKWHSGFGGGDRQRAAGIPTPPCFWEVEDTRRETSTTTVMLSQALELGGKRGARIEAASKGQDAARLELERRGNELRAEVVQAFYAAARAQAGLELARQSRTLAERGLEVAEGRVRAGKVSPVEATRAQVQLAETDLLVRRAETLKINSKRELARTTGSPLASFERLDYSDLSPGKLPPSAKLLNALNQSAELRLAQTQIEQREAALGSERAKRIPDLTVSVGSQYSREERERVNVVGLSMPLPLFDRNQGNVLAASRRADQSRDLRNAVELKLRTQTQFALDQWTTAAQEVESFDRVILPAAQRAVDTATRGFEMGKFGFLEVLDAQRTLISARNQYLESLATATEARVAIERIHGDLNRFSLNP